MKHLDCVQWSESGSSTMISPQEAIKREKERWLFLNFHGFFLYQLKVPKRENFSLAFFALSEPIWVCDLWTGEKNRIFYQLTPDFDSFWFFAAH